MLTPDELDWVVPILATHPHWKLKTTTLGGGWTGRVDVVVNRLGDHNLVLCLADGNTEVISHKKCLLQRQTAAPLHLDLRKAIVPDVRAFAERHPPPAVCTHHPRPRRLGAHSPRMVVDHQPPFTFSRLVGKGAFFFLVCVCVLLLFDDNEEETHPCARRTG